MKRYIGNTGQVFYIEEEEMQEPIFTSLPVPKTESRSFFAPFLSKGKKQLKLPFGLEAGDIGILLLFLFLYIESGDEEFLFIMAFFALSIFRKR